MTARHLFFLQPPAGGAHCSYSNMRRAPPGGGHCRQQKCTMDGFVSSYGIVQHKGLVAWRRTEATSLISLYYRQLDFPTWLVYDGLLPRSSIMILRCGVITSEPAFSRPPRRAESIVDVARSRSLWFPVPWRSLLGKYSIIVTSNGIFKRALRAALTSSQRQKLHEP